VSRVPEQMWPERGKSRRRRGNGELCTHTEDPDPGTGGKESKVMQASMECDVRMDRAYKIGLYERFAPEALHLC
jgi:hypothetical protein